jgi:hypothetical protein
MKERKSKDRQHNDQKKKDKQTNKQTNKQILIYKTLLVYRKLKIDQHESNKNRRITINSCSTNGTSHANLNIGGMYRGTSVVLGLWWKSMYTKIRTKLWFATVNIFS